MSDARESSLSAPYAVAQMVQTLGGYGGYPVSFNGVA